MKHDPQEGHQESSEKSSRSLLQILSVAFFLLFLVVFYLRQNNPESLKVSSAKKSYSAASVDPHARSKQVSRRMQELERKINLERDKVFVENRKLPKAPSPYYDKYPSKFGRGVQISRPDHTIQQDLRRGSQLKDPKTNPRQFIYKELSLQASEENEKVLEGLDVDPAKADYIRKMLINARKDGIDLIINKNLVVTGYRKFNPRTGEVSSEIVPLEPPKHGR